MYRIRKVLDVWCRRSVWYPPQAKKTNNFIRFHRQRLLLYKTLPIHPGRTQLLFRTSCRPTNALEVSWDYPSRHISTTVKAHFDVEAPLLKVSKKCQKFIKNCGLVETVACTLRYNGYYSLHSVCCLIIIYTIIDVLRRCVTLTVL